FHSGGNEGPFESEFNTFEEARYDPLVFPDGPSPTDLVFGEGKLEQAKFADPAHLDFRLQADSPYRGKAPGGLDPGAHQYQPTIYYVSPEGDDRADGLSVATAWKSLQKACIKAEPG